MYVDYLGISRKVDDRCFQTDVDLFTLLVINAYSDTGVQKLKRLTTWCAVVMCPVVDHQYLA